MVNNSFVFLRTFWKQVCAAGNDTEEMELVRAIVEYGLDGKDPGFSGLKQSVFIPIKFSIDKAKKNRKKNRENGRKGGRPRVTGDNRNKPGKISSNLNVNDNVNENVNGNGKDRRPSLTDILNFCHEEGLTIDCQRFYDYYDRNDWMTGDVPVRDWKALVRHWQENEFPHSAEASNAEEEKAPLPELICPVCGRKQTEIDFASHMCTCGLEHKDFENKEEIQSMKTASEGGK
jgi:hypothetical protein